jgi:choline dehydrogenase-like flavoprotein
MLGPGRMSSRGLRKSRVIMLKYQRNIRNTSIQSPKASLLLGRTQKKPNPFPDHGTNGPLHVSYAEQWEKGLTDVFKAAEEIGLGINPDVNSGNPIGMGLGAGCMYRGLRTTASAYLESAPSNLTIMLSSPVAKVLMSGNQARGVKTIDGRDIYAKNDVILSGGALNSPQLLMLSGIGPLAELKKHNIPVIHALEEVGKNMQDHCFSTATLLQKSGTNDRMAFETNADAVAAARAQHSKDKSGIMSSMYCSTPMGWFKNDAVLASKEFEALDKHTQEHLKKPTIPIFEITTVCFVPRDLALS